MTSNPTALILAGGFATRLWPLTEKRAKPLLPLAGKPLICHIIENIPADIPLIISTNQQFEESFLALKSLYPDRSLQVFIEDSRSDKAKAGALGATAMAIKQYKIRSPLLLVAGDNYFGFQISDFLAAYSGKTLLASYDTKSLEEAKQFGVLGVEGKRLVSFVEKPSDPPSSLISTGCYLFSPDHLDFIRDYARISADNLGGIFEYLLKKQQEVEVFPFSEQWIDIGSFQSYLRAHTLLLKKNQLSKESLIENTQIGSSVQVDKGCEIKDSELDEVIVMPNCRIANARLRQCIVDENCVIQGVDLNHKMVRAGSNIVGEEH